jgi:predicted ester cyclase
MSIEQNKMIAHQLMEAHDEGNVVRLHELFSPTFIWHIADVPQHLTRKDYIQGVEMGRQAFSNLTFSIEDMIAESEKVVLRSFASMIFHIIWLSILCVPGALIPALCDEQSRFEKDLL